MSSYGREEACSHNGSTSSRQCWSEVRIDEGFDDLSSLRPRPVIKLGRKRLRAIIILTPVVDFAIHLVTTFS